ncbi:MAG: type II toxin-antitoxin system VapC family toxin [Acidobacteria bacterium]|nr:type II toxin-antitoxin system VapC family toxin [Acidobacteriota bacterium]
MILLDTNVLSALMQTQPEPRVVAWLDAQAEESVWTTTVTVFEVRYGLELLAAGLRRRSLEGAFAKALEEDLGNRVLAFDRLAADAAGRLAASSRKTGRPVEIRDLQIAGIATARKATLATRNTRHFVRLGVELVDPWAG